MNTLLLDTVAWDLVIDSSGNIAMATAPYALAQDVASAVRTFLGELWYDTTQGIPYFQQPPLPLLSQMVQEATLSVPGVVTARCVILSFTDQQVSGQIIFTDNTGATTNVNFSS